jgi:hypothetical protein
MKEFLDHFAAILGAATVGLLLFSVCHEYGYFWIIGGHFQTLVSTSDYFTNATQWIVFTLMILYTWMDWKATFGLRRYYSPISMDWRTWIFPAVALFPFLLVTFFSPNSVDFALFFMFAYLWLVYGVRNVPFADSDEPVYKKIRAAILAVPFFAVLAFVAGKQKGVSALATMSDPYQVKVKGGEVRSRILLRSFDKGLLVRSPADERVEFIKWDQIEEVTKVSPKARDESYSCQWLEINCFKKSIVP